VVRSLELRGRRLALISLLPQARLVLSRWRLIPSTEGLVARLDDAPPEVIPWAELAPLAEDALLRLSGRADIVCEDSGAARSWQSRLERWREMDQETRAADFLLHARNSLDTAAVERAAQSLARQTRTLRRMGVLLLAWCFGVISGAYRWLGDGPEVLWLAGGMVLMLWAQAATFWRVARGADSKVRHRFWKTLAITFLPQHAMRAPDEIGSPLRAHPLAARSLLAESEWLRLCREFWKEARHSAAPGSALEARALEEFFSAQDVPLKELEPVPDRHPGAAAWCPRCMAQFQIKDALCMDCGGLELRAFDSGDRND